MDTEDRLIFSSHQNPSAPEAENNSLLFMVEHQPYHFPEILYRIREQKAPSQFSIHLGGVPYRISWTRIPSTNWLLIQHVAIADIGKIEAEQENDQRNALRQDLIRNMRSSGKKK